MTQGRKIESSSLLLKVHVACVYVFTIRPFFCHDIWRMQWVHPLYEVAFEFPQFFTYVTLRKTLYGKEPFSVNNLPI